MSDYHEVFRISRGAEWLTQPAFFVQLCDVNAEQNGGKFLWEAMDWRWVVGEGDILRNTVTLETLMVFDNSDNIILS